LASVEAGGVMELLDGHARTYTLTEIRRFTQDWERGASLRLREGDAAALAEYDKHGRLIGVDTLDDAIAQAARAAVADRMDDRTTVVVASTNELAASIACQVRDQLIDLGRVHSDGVLLGRDRNTGGVGDVVMCRRNDYRSGSPTGPMGPRNTETAVWSSSAPRPAFYPDGRSSPRVVCCEDVQLGSRHCARRGGFFRAQRALGHRWP
jgi:hypothetical protein